MTFSKVEIRTTSGLLMTLELDDVSDGLVLQDVGGLGPVDATIASSDFATVDGKQIDSVSRDDRQMTFQIGFKPDYAVTNVSQLRRRVYSFFMPKRTVAMKLFDSDGLELDISGVVKNCVPAIFTKEPALDVTIICGQPDFVDLETVVIEGETVNDSTETLIEYAGNIEAGVTLVLNLDRDLTEFTVYHRPPDDTVRTLDFAGDLEAGDILTITTTTGSKGASLNRGGTQSSVLYWVSPQAVYFQLEEGDNYIRVYAEGDPIPYTLSYQTRYGAL